MSPRLFIHRPILATVLSLCIMIVGLLAMRNLAVEQSPDITPPTVQVSATYPGASAEEVARALATPIESQLSGAEHMLYFSSSSSSDGNLTMTVTFEVGTNLDIAAVDVQNRVNRAVPQLPQSVTQLGITVTKQSPSILGLITLLSDDPRYDALFLSNYATINFLDAIKRVPGVGDARISASSDYTMRVILDPIRMAQLGISPRDIRQVLEEQNNSFAAGQLGREPAPKGNEFTIPVITQNRLSEVTEFEQLIVRSYPDGSNVRLKNVAHIEIGGQDYGMEGRFKGDVSANIIINLSSGANALDTLKALRAVMDDVAKRFPPGITYQIPFETTPFISASVEEVVKTLGEAMLLVFLVVYLFLQNWRATLIPCLTVPVSLIGTFAGMYALGFTINTLTLFGMVLAIGIVVDDAIVVLENVERIMHEEKLSPRDATIKAMGEITGPVIAIVLVLCSVFIPVAFLSGISGQLYRQFAITIAISVTLSGVVALTLCPALCAVLLKADHTARRGPVGRLFDWFFRHFNQLVERMTHGYSSVVGGMIRHMLFSVLLFGGMLAITAGLLRERPTGFIPAEDQGYFMVGILLPDGASKERTTAVLEKVEQYLLAQPEIESVAGMNGSNRLFDTRSTNGATLFPRLRDWKERPGEEHHVTAVIARAMKEFSNINEAIILCVNPPPIRGLGNSAGYTMQVLNRSGDDLQTFTKKAMAFYDAAAELPQVQNQNTGFRLNAPKIFANLDRDRAKALGIPIDEVFSTLRAYLGTMYINDFYKYGRVYKVQLEGDPVSRMKPSDFQRIFVRNDAGKMIPLNTVVHTTFTTGPDNVTHFNGYDSITIRGASAPGYSSGETLAALEKLAAEQLHREGLDYAWSDVSYQEKLAGSDSYKIFLFALLMVFLVLAAQYESWAIPLAVIVAVPIGVMGALLAIYLRDLNNDIYFQIGLITLIGLAAKNAILIVEFANARLTSGMPLLEATLEACRLRIRPIVMTSLAFILGVFPLVIASGAGAAGRHAIGTGVFGGMLAATFLAVLFVPIFYVLIVRFTHRIRGQNHLDSKT